MNFVLSMDLYCIVDAEAALMDGYLWKRSHESIKAAIVGSFTVQIPRMDEMPHSIGKFVKRCSNINLGVNHFMTPCLVSDVPGNDEKKTIYFHTDIFF